MADSFAQPSTPVAADLQASGSISILAHLRSNALSSGASSATLMPLFQVSTLNCTCSGMCLHDEDCAFVLARPMCFTCLRSVDVGEALGLFHALE